MPPLLSIAIPTFNRSDCLRLALTRALGESEGFEEQVEVLVSDNHSDDATPSVIAAMQARHPRLRAFRNASNLGPDANILQCFTHAIGRYIWIIGDDDFVLPGAIRQVLEVIQTEAYGLVAVGAYPFSDDYQAERPASSGSGVTVYESGREFGQRAQLMLTFLSSTIVRRSAVGSIDHAAYLGTNLVQLSWLLPALFSGAPHARIEAFCIAGKQDNTGGYALGRVFGPHLRRLLADFCTGWDGRAVAATMESHLLRNFFPKYIVDIRNRPGSFESENFYRILAPLFRRRIWFWLNTVPAIALPTPVAAKYQRCFHWFASRPRRTMQRFRFRRGTSI